MVKRLPRLKHLPAMQETWVRSMGREDPPGEGNGNPVQFSGMGNFMAKDLGDIFHLVTKPPQ